MKLLQLEFSEVEGKIISEICLGREYESFPGIVHGGIVSLILDEVMGEVAHRREKAPAMTVGLKIRFIQSMRTDEPYIARAEFSEKNGATVDVRGELKSPRHGLTAVASATFFLMSTAELSNKKEQLPDITWQYFSQFDCPNLEREEDKA
jgi:acyl-coenzyme A thioesterase PaaI-like protein